MSGTDMQPTEPITTQFTAPSGPTPFPTQGDIDMSGSSIHSSAAASGFQNSSEADDRSVYVGNVDYSATPQELQSIFASCGTINRITIICDKYTSQPKGYAYIEFENKTSVANAVMLEGNALHGRPLRVVPKRTNVPGMHYGRGGFRGGRGGNFRGGRGSGFAGGRGGRAGYRGRGMRHTPY